MTIQTHSIAKNVGAATFFSYNLRIDDGRTKTKELEIKDDKSLGLNWHSSRVTARGNRKERWMNVCKNHRMRDIL